MLKIFLTPLLHYFAIFLLLMKNIVLIHAIEAVDA